MINHDQPHGRELDGAPACTYHEPGLSNRGIRGRPPKRLPLPHPQKAQHDPDRRQIPTTMTIRPAPKNPAPTRLTPPPYLNP